MREQVNGTSMSKVSILSYVASLLTAHNAVSNDINASFLATRFTRRSAAALWLLSTYTPNAVAIASEGYAISKIIALMRPKAAWDAKSFVAASRSFNKKAYGDILCQNLVGTLRRAVATQKGDAVVTQQKLGFTLIETLWTIVNMPSAKIELLREAAGLIFFLREAPEVSELRRRLRDEAVQRNVETSVRNIAAAANSTAVSNVTKNPPPSRLASLVAEPRVHRARVKVEDGP